MREEQARWDPRMGSQFVVSAHKTFDYIGVTHCFLGIELSKMNMEIVRPVLT